MEREAFLDRLRARMGEPPENLAHPLPADRGVPRPGYAPTAAGDEVDRLREVAAAKGWQVRAGGDALEATLTELIARHDVRRAVCTAEPAAATAARLLVAAGVEVLPFDGPANAARADLGVTGAAYAIAATGTVVLSSGAAGGRAAALVPPVHLALVDAADVVATPADIWRQLPERFPDGLPSQLVFASGPSRSADIEFTLTVGVHGPKAVWMAIS